MWRGIGRREDGESRWALGNGASMGGFLDGQRWNWRGSPGIRYAMGWETICSLEHAVRDMSSALEDVRLADAGWVLG